MQLMLAQPKIDVDSSVVPFAAFDPPIIKQGEESTYRVTLNALETAVDWPDKIPAPLPLACRQGAHGQILSMNGALLVPHTTFNYRVHPSAAGQFSIPQFTVKVNGKSVVVPPAQLEVAVTLPPGVAPAQQLLLDLPTNGLFVGQAIHARILLPGTLGGMVQSLGQVQINGQGIIVDQSSAHARIEALPIGAGGRHVNTFVYELMLTPIAVGKLVVSAQAYAVGNRVMGGVIMPGPGAGTLPLYTLVDSNPVSLEIRPLPRESELPGFTGAVGAYSVDPPELGTNVVSVGEPVRLKIKIRGDGNLARLVPPPLPRLHDWQVFTAAAESAIPQIIQAQGFVTFEYTLIPLTEKTRGTPVLPFSAFNPERGSYDNLTIPSLAVTVLPGVATAADLQTLVEAQNTDIDKEKEPALSGLAVVPGIGGRIIPVQMRAWFPLLHVVPGGALFWLWLWDRRRRYFELHPEFVLRRRALRALRRERRTLERATRARDSSGFASVAVNAMKLAVAPHYPAEPRALVGADVIGMLPEEERTGQAGQTVRRLFAHADASRFAAVGADTSELLDLQPEIEGVLNQLEARLCT
jgi:hypothetical protein